MPITTLDIENLGPVVFSQTRRAKRLSITVAPFKGVRVAFPMRVSLKKARSYLLKHVTWTRECLDDMRRVEQAHAQTVHGGPAVSSDKAAAYLRQRLAMLALHYDFNYNRVFIRNQKTRWGSCSEANNINLNINLVKLTPELRDYVLLHELVHTRIKNHSRQFWAELDQYVGNARQLDKQLKKHHLGL